MIQPIDITEMQRDYMLAATSWGRQTDAPRLIIERECEANGVPMADVLSDKRDRRTAHLRQDIIALIYERTNMSTPAIGSMFGRDHTTVLYAIKSSKARKQGKPMYITAQSTAPKLSKAPMQERTVNPKGLSYAEVCRLERERTKERDGLKYIHTNKNRTGPNRVFEVIRDNPGIERDKAADILGISSKTLNYHVRVLRDQGRVMRLRTTSAEPYRYYPRAAQ